VVEEEETRETNFGLEFLIFELERMERMGLNPSMRTGFSI
jgi:hypothetical protein